MQTVPLARAGQSGANGGSWTWQEQQGAPAGRVSSGSQHCLSPAGLQESSLTSSQQTREGRGSENGAQAGSGSTLRALSICCACSHDGSGTDLPCFCHNVVNGLPGFASGNIPEHRKYYIQRKLTTCHIKVQLAGPNGHKRVAPEWPGCRVARLGRILENGESQGRMRDWEDAACWLPNSPAGPRTPLALLQAILVLTGSSCFQNACSL